MLTRFREEERGLALVVSLMVTFVVLLIATAVIAQSIHNVQQAGYDRKRLTGVNAAEAGLNWFFGNVQNAVTTSSSTLLRTTPYTASLGDAPGTTSFAATPTYYLDAAGTVPFSGSVTTNSYPGSMKIVSVGTASDGTTRKMETFIVLHPVYSGLTGALITNSSEALTNNITISGYNGNDGDIYVLTGNFTAPSGLQAVKGNIYVTNGYANIGTSVHIYGSVWTGGASGNGYVNVDAPGALIDGDVKSANDYVTVNRGTVKGDAYYCAGSAPSNVQGNKTHTCALGPPPTQTFPQVQFNAGAWQSQGYYVLTYTGATACTDARAYVEGNGAGTFQGGNGVPAGYTGVAVRIQASCTYSNSSNATVRVGKNLAIIADGGIQLTQRSTWNGPATGSPTSLFFNVPWPSSGSPSCTWPANGTFNAGEVYVGNLTNFDSQVQVSVYSPCEVTMLNNNSNFNGQVIGGAMTVGNLFSMSYRPVLIPGANFSGFREDVAYMREVK